MELEKLLTKNFIEKYNIDINDNYEIKEVYASDLLVPERMDLIVKIKYIEYKEKGYDMTYIKNLYKSHIEAFSCGTFQEPGNNEKCSIDKYFEMFDSFIDSIKLNGFDKDVSIVPVGINNIILNGAHRTAIGIYYNMKIPIIYFEGKSVNYGVRFFEERLLEKRYIDYMVSEYVKFKKNTHVACIWPRAEMDHLLENKVRELITEECKIVYKKQIKLSLDGMTNLISQIYSHHSWVGDCDNGYRGAQNKAKACHIDNGRISVYIIESSSLKTVIELKSKIRNIFNIENHSIHITDNYYEAMQINNYLLNDNSIRYLNYIKPSYYTQNCKQINMFKQEILRKDQVLEDFVIVSSAVLALLGLRNARDIDFITLSNQYATDNNNIGSHNEYSHFYPATISSLITNPENYFYYFDLKFLTLENVKQFKRKRSEKKDLEDIVLIDKFLNNKRDVNFYTIRYRLALKRILRNINYKIKNKTIVILKKVKLFNFARKIFKLLKGTE